MGQKTRGFPSEARAFRSDSSCTKGIKLLFFYLSNQTTHVSTDEYRLRRPNLSRDTMCPDLGLNIHSTSYVFYDL